MSMPMPPPDTRAPGQTGHIADHNTISDSLAALENAVGTLEDGAISLSGGDLGGTADAPEVLKIQGTAIEAPSGGTANYLREDGTWAPPPGTTSAVSTVFGRSGAVVAQSGDYSVGQVTGAAPLTSPAFGGTPTAPTQTTGDNSTKLANTAFVALASTATLAAARSGNMPAPAGTAAAGMTPFATGSGSGSQWAYAPAAPLQPSGDTTGVTDLAAINRYLAAGIPVQLASGVYYVSGPIVIPDGGYLSGANPSWGIPTGNYGAGGLPLQGSVIQASSTFTGSSIIFMGAVGAVQHGGQRLYSLTVNGTGAPAGTHGIMSQGFVAAVKMRDVSVWGAPGDGLHIVNDGTTGHQADFWQADSCKFSHCGGWGVLTQGISDSWFVNSESTGNTSGGWSITGGSDTRWLACRGDSNTSGPGWLVSPTTAGNRLEWVNCEANLNSTVGWQFASGVAEQLFLAGCIASGNTTAPWSYASGAMVHCDGGNFTVWMPMSLSNGWANSGSGPAAQFALRGSSVEVIGDLTAGTLSSGTVAVALPSAVTPAHVQQLPLTDITTRTAQGALNCGTGGTLSFFQGIGTVAASDRCFFHGTISTDA